VGVYVLLWLAMELWGVYEGKARGDSAPYTAIARIAK